MQVVSRLHLLVDGFPGLHERISLVPVEFFDRAD
jgi:hypothetical protein